MHPDVLDRLLQGGSLNGLGLATTPEGRRDLRGLTVPEPSVGKMTRTAIADVAELRDVRVLRGVTWKGLDLSGARLNGLRFFDCVIEDCIFDRCTAHDWRIWSTAFSDTRFVSADLRNSALGGVQEGRRNTFHQVDFTRADLRGTMYKAAEFIGCTFKDTRLDKVNFQTSTFTDCRFEGELREVLFYRTGFEGEAFPTNEMTNVDLTRAKLRWVAFRGLDLETVRFPEDGLVVTTDYKGTLDRLIQEFSGKPDLSSRKLATIFEMDRKWAGAHQRRGVFSTHDLLEMAGPEGLARVREIIEQGAR
ncbi:MAG: pentapeptide repeat-containing protein [Acidiferrobacteraceae bacterium]